MNRIPTWWWLTWAVASAYLADFFSGSPASLVLWAFFVVSLLGFVSSALHYLRASPWK